MGQTSLKNQTKPNKPKKPTKTKFHLHSTTDDEAKGEEEDSSHQRQGRKMILYLKDEHTFVYKITPATSDPLS